MLQQLTMCLHFHHFHNKQFEKKILFLLLALNLIRGMFYSILIPLWQTPDEHWHFEYIKLLREKPLTEISVDDQYKKELQHQISQSLIKHKFWELQHVELRGEPSEVRAFSRGELHHPPLYYLACAFLLKILALNNVEGEVYVLRFVSVILATAVVLMSYYLTKEIFPNDPFLLVGVPLFIVFLPQYTFMSSGINNDKLAEVLFSLLLLFMIKSTKYRLTPIFAIVIVTIVIIGFFTKKTTLASIPLSLLFFVISFKREKLMYKYMVRVLIFLGIGAILVVSLYLWKPSVFGTFEEYTGIPQQSKTDIIQEITAFPANVTRYFSYTKLLFSSFWASFGWLDIYLSNSWYRGLFIVDLIAITGVFAYGIQVFKEKILLESWQKKSLVILLVAMILAVMQVFIRDTILSHVVAPHVRMFFVAIIPISLFFMLGIREWIRRISYKKALLMTALLFAGFDTVCLYFYIIPYYYGIFY